MAGNLTLEDLKKAVSADEIDTVLACAIDMQGRLIGKRFHARYFVELAHHETHGCNYLLANDIDMEPVPGYKAASWSKGYGDFVMKPDIATLRHIPWLEKTALVLCDIQDHHTHEDLPHSPRAILSRQVARLKDRGYMAYFASELEFYLFQETYETARAKHWSDLATASPYIEDYVIQLTTKEEDVMRAIRNGLFGAGIPIESSKGEAEIGQEELNYHYSDALDTADNHVLLKNAAKEIAWSKGKSVTFMAKYDTDRTGSSSHIHQSLWSLDGTAAFADKEGTHGMSALMRHYLAGQLAHAREITAFLAPYVNSYKRFTAGLFAPTKAVWSIDNRTAGFRICGAHTAGVRVECRIPGSDINPYLACAALLAAGLDGVERKLELEPELTGDMYQAEGIRDIPKTLREAAELMQGSEMLRAALGDDVVEHYHHACEWEIAETDRVVTDFERQRLFERA